MNNCRISAVVLALLAVATATAQQAAPPQTSPRQKRLSPLQQKLRGSLQAYVARVMEKNYGFFPVEDPDYGDVWMAELQSVDMERVRRVYDDKYILRATFQETPMEEAPANPAGEQGGDAGAAVTAAPKKTFLVDFTLVRRRSGRWGVTDPALFKIDAEQLFSYSENHKREPLERDPKTTVFSFGGEGRNAPDSGENVANSRGGDPFAAESNIEFQEGDDPFSAPVEVKKSTAPPKRASKGPPTGPNADGPNTEGGAEPGEEDDLADKIFQ